MSACDEEPCKSLIDQYWAKAIEGWEAELVLRLLCDVWKTAWRAYWILFSLWIAVFLHALACAALHLPPLVCNALTVASIVLMGALLFWAVRIMFLRRLVRQQEEACSLIFHELLSIRRAIAVKCPRECQPEAVRIKCTC